MMFKHSDGWHLNTQILKLVTRDENETRHDLQNYALHARFLTKRERRRSQRSI